MDENKKLLEEAIKHFKSLQKRYTKQHNEKMHTKVAVALEAMEKQIIKKPNKVERIDLYYTVGKCPTCGVNINNGMKHCDNCGQAVTWAEELKND